MGALIALRHPGNPVGWIMLAIGLFEALFGFGYEYAAYSLILNPGSLPGGSAMAWLSFWAWIPELSLFPFMVLLFPAGRSLSRRWSSVGWIAVAWWVVFMVFALALLPYRGPRFLGESESLGVKQLAILEDIAWALYRVAIICVFASLISLLIRFRRSYGQERQQLKWLALAALLGSRLPL